MHGRSRTRKDARAAISKLRRFVRRLAAFLALVLLLTASAGNWFVRHPREWLEQKKESLPSFLTDTLFYLGEPFADLTDSFGITGEDAVCKVTAPFKGGSVFFAGVPVRKTNKAPDDITVANKGSFTVAYSDKLRHPVWCAYKVGKEPKFTADERPGFRKDKTFKSCPPASAYAKTGYDRGHMAPNHAIATRYGPEAQKKTFLMSNIAPQTPELNRGVWREVEHRIADLFTAKWGDAWVIVGAVSNGSETLSGTDIDVPTQFYQIIAAESDGEIRALAFLFEQEVPWKAWPRHYIASIDEIEEITGFDFFAELEDSVEAELESKKPTRLWPVHFFDAFRALKIHLNDH